MVDPTDQVKAVDNFDVVVLGSGHRCGLRVPEGDFRDWKEIKAWAAEIADAQRPGS